MENIKYVVLHHSVTPRDLPLQKSVQSFDNSHKERLHPEPNSLGHYCAYHYVIAGDGSKAHTRGIPDNFEVGYHASNLTVNRESIGICLTGNFDEEEPSKEQIKTLVKLLHWIRKQPWGKDVEIIGHTDVEDVTKTCPGQNLYNLIPNIISMSNPQVPDWAEESWALALEQGIISEESIPNDYITKAEMIVIMDRAGCLDK